MGSVKRWISQAFLGENEPMGAITRRITPFYRDFKLAAPQSVVFFLQPSKVNRAFETIHEGYTGVTSRLIGAMWDKRNPTVSPRPKQRPVIS